MSEALGNWLLHTLVGGGGLLLAAWLALRRWAAPVRRQRLGEWAMFAAMLVALLSCAPAWLIVTLPDPETASAGEQQEIEQPAGAGEPVQVEMPAARDIEPMQEIPPMVIVGEQIPEEAPAANVGELSPQPLADARGSVQPFADVRGSEDLWRRALTVAVALYLAGVFLLLGRWILGHIALWRLRRGGEAVPPAVAALFASMTRDCHRSRLLLSKRVRVPFSFGLFRATVVLPAALAATASPRLLRWIFLHELTHVRRRDAWSSALFGLGQALYYPLPWFWRLRRQVRLCQEYIADAAAAAPDGPEDYAQFLLGWTAAPRAPAGVSAVFGSPSDLFWRITMLLHTPSPLEPRCPRRWSLAAAGGLLSFAVLAAGIGFAAPVPVKKDDKSKKEEVKKPAPKEKEIDKDKDKGKRPKVAGDEPDLPPGVPPDIAEQIRQQRKIAEKAQEQARQQIKEQMKLMEKAMEQARQNFGGQPPAGFGGFPGAGGAWGLQREVRLGVGVAKPDSALAEQLDLPKGQGLVVRDVLPDSAASKAGLKKHDILLELNGKAVPDRLDGLSKLIADIKADTPVDAVVLRKGKKETIKGVKLPKAAAAGIGRGFGQGGPGAGFAPPPAGGVAGGPPAGFGGGRPGGIGINANFNPFGGGDNRTVMTTIFRTDDRFTTRHQEGSLIITLTGKASGGKAKVKEIQVQDGTQTKKYESVDKVPEQYRDKVKNLVEMSEKNNVRIEIKEP